MDLRQGIDHDGVRLGWADDIGIAPWREVTRDDLARLIDEDQFRLRAAAIDADFEGRN